MSKKMRLILERTCEAQSLPSGGGGIEKLLNQPLSNNSVDVP